MGTGVNAFVTGATGFVGSAVVRCLLRRGCKVKALVRATSSLLNLTGLDVELNYGDLFDEDAMHSAMCGCDVVYHIAAKYSTDEEDSSEMYEVNVRGTRTVLGTAVRAGVPRAVHTSTIGTIGQPLDGGLATEQVPFTQWESASDYAKSKYLGEIVALDMCQMGLSVVVVNPCAPVGAGDIKPSSTGQRILDYLGGRQPSFAPGGINFIYVDDVAEGHLLAAERGRAGERYILGNRDGNLQLAEFLDLMKQVSGEAGPSEDNQAAVRLALRRAKAALRLTKLRPSRAGDEALDHRPVALTCDPSKAIRELGLPQTPLRTAFAEAVSWFRQQGYVHATE